ncbi:UDP-N-acetylmuramoyl-L-alanyl-D-glutamate--2,6-diaminopimelate ligase [Hydrogenivirga sp.]
MALPEKLIDALRRAKGISADSRQAGEGYVFFALKGTRHDGHDFVGEVLKKGVLAVVIEKEVGVKDPRIVRVDSTREVLGEAANLFFGEPSRKLRVIGVTGTNGKTTTTYIIERILAEAGFSPGLLGTIQYRLGNRVLGSGRTTPDPITWHSSLREMLTLGATHVVAEVSSHALDQLRVWGTEFEAVIFTNLTQDHLDYHGDMESYFRAKRRLFSDYSYRFAVVNVDDPYGVRLAEELGSRAVTYGRKGELRILDFETGFEGSRIRVGFRGREYEFTSSLIGDFQAYNISAALSYALEVGIEPEAVQRALREVHVPGRLAVYRSSRGFIAVIDYAHTPDAMENVLRTLRKLSRKRLISVFGAGGNRDRGKRPLMGRAAERWSDIVVVTSDNPRDEEPEEIIEDVLKGMDKREELVVEPDRREAIRKALEMAQEGDIVAILGKGHEDYQEVKGVKYPFSDSEVVEEYI